MIGRRRLRPIRARLWLAAGAASLFALAVAPPLLQAAGHPAGAALLRAAFSAVCHQIPGRSILLAGSPLAVCARCAGLYAGFAAGCAAAAFAARRRGAPPEGMAASRMTAPGRVWLLIAATPSALEFAFEQAGVWTGGGAARALTGALLGFALAFYAAAAVEELPAEIVEEIDRLLRDPGRSHAKAR